MSRRRVAITGASGFLGWHAGNAFRAAGWEVRALVRPGSRKPVPDDVERVEAALDAKAVSAALADCDVVVHAAGIVRAGKAHAFEAVNVSGTRAVVAAANAAGARVVFVSSQAAIGPGTLHRPARECDQPRPLTPYGRSKLAAERVVAQDAVVPWTIVRPASVYGPRDRQFLPLFRLAARGVFPLVTRRDASFTLIHVNDVVRALVAAAADPRAVGEAFFLGHGRPQREAELLALIADAVGRPYRPVRVPRAALGVAAWLGDAAWRLGREPLVDRARLAELGADGFVCAVDHAALTLGFRAETPLAEGVAETARWYRERGWI
jgi:nucleoside-diphosphate-sugar epimerase